MFRPSLIKLAITGLFVVFTASQAFAAANVTTKAMSASAPSSEKATKPQIASEGGKILTPEQASALFNEALAVFHRENYVAAAAQFWQFLTRSPANIDNYGWGQYFLAECFRNLDFSYAAQVYYYLVAKTRSQPEVIADTLGQLEVLTRTKPFDENLLYEDLLYGGDFGILTPTLASWVGYVQGLYDYQRNAMDWGERHFKNVDRNSRYNLDVTYVKAVYAVREHHDPEALSMFHSIISSPLDAPLVKNKARLAQARLLFERSKFDEAIAAYDSVEQVDLSYEQAQILTEKAWASYYTKDYAKALGLLHSLGAPSYEDFFFPETYLLRALIFKDLCHYLAAKNVVRGFRFKYGRAIDQLKQRLPMEQVDRVKRAATREGAIARRTHFLQLLRREMLNVSDHSEWRSTGLSRQLYAMYEGAMKTQDRRWHEQFAREADAVALRLLETEEQVNILDYEISLDIYKPLDDREVTLAQSAMPDLPDRASHSYYEFDGEYWNAELSTYQYYINSRCMGREP